MLFRQKVAEQHGDDTGKKCWMRARRLLRQDRPRKRKEW